MAVTGIDISEDMIKNALKRNHAAVQQGRVVFALGDCCDLKFPDGTFDAVTSINTIYFWQDTIKGIQILFKKGLCFRWKKAGFSDVIIEDIVKGKSFTITYMKKPKSHE